MPDLAIHISTAALARRALPAGPGRLAILLGTCLPDIVYKSLHFGLQIPRDFLLPTHTPAGVLLLSYALALLFHSRERAAVFAGLLAGGLLHLVLDGLKAHLTVGGILVGFPFSWTPVRYELFRPENGIYLTVPAIILAVGVEWICRRK